jgi:hypothetical protein
MFQILDGVNKKLSDNNPTGTAADIMFGSNLPLITTNVSGMFKLIMFITINFNLRSTVALLGP